MCSKPTVAVAVVITAAQAIVLAACSRDMSADTVGPAISLPFEEYELDNGLHVILHVDRSDPVAAVLMTFHVGSAREVPSRTGFAHLFEHLFFLDSENLGPGGLDRLMNRVGSATNGSTDNDRTNYYEVVPNDALEKAIWAESDKLGFFINTVTTGVLEKEKQVVKNEKRQRVDNVPYGHTFEVISRTVFPASHPYSWPVIGSLADVTAASLEDVVEFHRRWYGPNNATLTIAGDIDIEQTKAWIEHYFGEIPARPTPAAPALPRVALEAEQRLLHEDNFAELPELTMVWPGVPSFAADSYALEVLAALLADGKQTPLHAVVVEEEQLAPAVFASSQTGELAGLFTLQARAHAGVDLDRVRESVTAAFARFERDGVADTELERIKAGYEAELYDNLSSVLGKAMQLTDYRLFAPRTDYINEHLRGLLGVSADDVMRVYATYIKDRPAVVTSFVPSGAPELGLERSVRADVVVEQIVPNDADLAPPDRSEVALTPSMIDRATEPPFGAAPVLRAPVVSTAMLDNGLGIYVIEDSEIPLVELELRISGGQLTESGSAPGAANLLAEILTEGTAKRTPEELELAIDQLGATIEVAAEPERVVLSARVLARNFEPTIDLLREMLLEPRWDEARLVLAKERVKSALRARAADPFSIAEDAFAGLLYGDHALGRNLLGSQESIDAMTMDDLRAYYARTLIPNAAALLVAGAVDSDRVVAAARTLALDWRAGEARFPDPPTWDRSRRGLYFIDVPGSAQSVLAIGYLALAVTDTDYYPAVVMNFRLGGGGFASDLTQVLREQYGYTYGIRSRFAGSDLIGPFRVQSLVRSNVTLESLGLIKQLIERHGADFDADDLAATRGFLLKSNAGAFETLGAKLTMLENISAYGFSPNYVLEREAIVRDMTVERIRELAERYLQAGEMTWLVVGDAATQLERLRDLGLGEPTLLQR